MAVFKFSCPFCRESLEAKDEWRGKLTQCPECGKNLVVPLISKVDYDEFDAIEVLKDIKYSEVKDALNSIDINNITISIIGDGE